MVSLNTTLIPFRRSLLILWPPCLVQTSGSQSHIAGSKWVRKKGELLIPCGPFTCTPAGSRSLSEPCPSISSQVEQAEHHVPCRLLVLFPLHLCPSCSPVFNLALRKPVSNARKQMASKARGASSPWFTGRLLVLLLAPHPVILPWGMGRCPTSWVLNHCSTLWLCLGIAVLLFC